MCHSKKLKRLKMSISEMFTEKEMVKVCAPMVRYSRLEFRTLVRKYDCDLCFTPMIMADSFIKSEKARNHEFITNSTDRPVIVQFAANNIYDFSEAAKLVFPYSSGVDLNCGCPQRWAMKIGIGAHLLSEPETIKNIVLNVRNQISCDYSVSVKVRLLNDSKSSVDLCKKLESAGVTFLTVHGRTKEQRTQPINMELLRDIQQCLQIPLIANGDVKTLDDAYALQKFTGCQGVMSGRGLLQNPTLFKGYNKTSLDCIKHWVEIALKSDLYFVTFHHHLVFMLEKNLPKKYRQKFNALTNYAQVLAFLNDYYGFNFSYTPSESLIPKADVDVKKPNFSTESNYNTNSNENILFDIYNLYH